MRRCARAPRPVSRGSARRNTGLSRRAAAAWLADPLARGDAPAAVPATVSAALSGRALIVDPGRGELGLFPVLGGRVLDARARWASLDGLEGELSAVDWSAPADATAGVASDWPWLTSWLRSPKARAGYLVVREDEPTAALAARAAAALRVSRLAVGDGGKVRATRGRD